MGVSRDVFDKRIRQAVKASAIEVQDEAQTHHNYTSRTGDLTRSIDTAEESQGLEMGPDWRQLVFVC